jgi:hypothetical protein
VYSLCFIAGVADTGDKLSPALLLPTINYHRCSCYWRVANIVAGVVTGDKLIAGVMESMKIWYKA